MSTKEYTFNTVKPKPGTRIRLINESYAGIQTGAEGEVQEPGEFENYFPNDIPEFTVDIEDGEWYLPIADKDVRWEVIA